MISVVQQTCFALFAVRKKKHVLVHFMCLTHNISFCFSKKVFGLGTERSDMRKWLVSICSQTLPDISGKYIKPRPIKRDRDKCCGIELDIIFCCTIISRRMTIFLWTEWFWHYCCILTSVFFNDGHWTHQDEYASDCNDMIWTMNKQTMKESYHRLVGVVIGSGALWINNNKKINLYHAHPIANQLHDPIGLHQT